MCLQQGILLKNKKKIPCNRSSAGRWRGSVCWEGRAGCAGMRLWLFPGMLSVGHCHGIHTKFPGPLPCALNRTLEHGRGGGHTWGCPMVLSHHTPSSGFCRVLLAEHMNQKVGLGSDEIMAVWKTAPWLGEPLPGSPGFEAAKFAFSVLELCSGLEELVFVPLPGTALPLSSTRWVGGGAAPCQQWCQKSVEA